MVGKHDFRDPMRPVQMPAWTYIRSWLRIVPQTKLPLTWSLRAAQAAARLRMVRRPRLHGHVRQAIGLITDESLTERTLRCYISRAIAVRRMGGHTYAPVSRRSRQWLLRALRPEGIERLERLRAEDGGVIVLGTHVGLSGWVGPVLRGLGYPVKLLQRKRVAPETLLLLQRDGWLGEVLPYPSDKDAGPHLKKLHELLLSGSWLQHSADYGGAAGLSGRYFGRQVRCYRAPWVLSRLTGAPAVPVLILSDERMRARMIVGPVLRVPADGPAQEAMQRALQTYLDFVVAHVGPWPWNMTRPDWVQG